jgi:aldehyde dehydrogenase (NAD+)
MPDGAAGDATPDGGPGGGTVAPVRAGALAGVAPADGGFAYAPSRESTDLVAIRARYGLWVGGEEVEARSGRTMTTTNPATEEPLAEVAEAGPEDVDLAVAAARQAYEDGWRDLPGRERAKVLYRVARQLQERARELAVLETLDGGKPIKESRDVDVPLAAAHFFHHAGWADKLEWAFANRTPSPLGVVGQVIPWNFPCSWRRGSSRRHSPPATRSC